MKNEIEIEAGPRMATPPLLRGRLPAWVRNARRGQRITYHIGDLANDRERTIDGDPETRTEFAATVHRTAQAALHFFQEGYLVLCQIPKRRDDGTRGVGYNYVAVRTDKQFKEN